MNPVQQEVINKCKLDFLKISAKEHRLDIQDKALLTANITQILGIYELRYDKQLYHLLMDMIRFGENNLVLAGQRLQFDELNRKYKVQVDYKPIKWESSFLK